MNESLLRDLHDTQIEELNKLKSAITELTQRPTATPTDIAKVQMMIANIKIPTQDNSQATETLQHLQSLSQKLDTNADNHLKWLQAIYQYSKSIDEKDSTDSKVMARGIEELKSASKKISETVFEVKISHFMTLLWGIVATALYASSLYQQHSMRDQLVELRENSLKYRYIKMKGEATPKRISDIEDIFKYNRDYDKILEVQNDVVAFEEAVEKKAIADEQARLQKLESERLSNEANKLKQK